MKSKKSELIGYACGGIGHNLIYALFSGYLLIFYTDVFELSAGFTGLLFLIARIFDAVNDPIMGVIADKTNSKLGRYRVWLYRAAPVIGAALCLCFFVPDIGKMAQYIYCYVTYILMGVSFTCADIPYWSLPSVMTDDAMKRNKIFSIGSIAGSLASGIGAVAVPMIVSNATDFATGYLTAAIAFSIVGIIGYVLCGSLVRERLEIHREHYSLKMALSTLFKNKPLLIVMAASLFGNLAFQLKVSMNTYYGQYALGDYGYVTYLSAMLLVGMLIGASCIPIVVKKLGAKGAMKLTLLAGVIISAIYYISGYQSLVTVLIFSALSAVVVGAFTVLVTSMTADTIDYAEVHVGQRNEGIITSTRTFITKLATAIAGAVIAFALELIQYTPNVEQTVLVKDGFHACMSAFPGIMYLIGFIIICFYPLTKEKFQAMEEKLQEMRCKN